MKQYKILVTGACGVTSRSVVRALNDSAYFQGKCEFIGTDVCYNEYGIYEGLYKRVYKVPPFNAPEYRSMIEQIIKRHDIEYAVVIPEPEVLYWCENPFDVKFMSIPPAFARRVLSKKSLYDALKNTGLVPQYEIQDRETLLSSDQPTQLEYPVWIRDFAEGTTSGKGSFLASDESELKAWILINKGIDNFMISEYLPGKNLACFLLFANGSLVKYGVAERMEYVMGKVAVSGITGNTSKGKLLNYDKAYEIALEAVSNVAQQVNERMNGLVVVDMRENAEGEPMVTEINIRHVAFTSSFALGGLNFSEAQMLILSGQSNLVTKEKTLTFPEDNIILRDVDGLPIYIENYKQLEMGDFRE